MNYPTARALLLLAIGAFIGVVSTSLKVPSWAMWFGVICIGMIFGTVENLLILFGKHHPSHNQPTSRRRS